MRPENVTVAFLAAAMACGAGVYNVVRDTSADRVSTPLNVNLTRVGTLQPRAAHEIHGSNWRLGCEILDRDYMNFDEYKEHVEPLGIKLVRLQGGWAKCEKEKGKYDFAWLDHIVDYLQAQGVDCAIETSYGNPIYAGGGTIDLAAGFPSSEEGLAGWDAWVDALSKHFKGRVDKFLMWNEPDIRPRDGSEMKTPEQIAAFNVRTAKTILKNIPQAHLAGLSLARCSSEFFESCLKAMGEDVKLFDTFIYHGYQNAPESSYDEVEKHKAVLAKYNPAARMWQGENGCPSEMALKFALSRVAWSEYSQAKWDMRRMLGDLGHDVESGLFCIVDFNYQPPTFPVFFCNRKGYLRANASNDVIRVKRSYYAVQNTVGVFDATVKRVREGQLAACTDRTVSLYEYRTANGSPLLAFWHHGPVKVEPAKAAGSTFQANQGLKIVLDPEARPGDSFETRGVAFTWGGRPFVDPVWVDLMTGW
ncbi:MAG: beta-galactosidase, partial [Kiritimatiellae bacterium]|nr:beta-galactosidase [Kiritimatiellia bacterium]